LKVKVRSVVRWIGWRRIGVVLSLCVFALALMILARILNGIDVDEVTQAFRAMSPQRILLAACFVAGSYFTLTFYDLFALRTLGFADIPYRIAALSSFTSYSIGHNVGASAVTGGAVRYRIYSARGLDAVVVAKICFLTGLTFWLGNATVLGICVALGPAAASAIDLLSPAVNRTLALALLALVGSYLVWVWMRPRLVGRNGWQVRLPSGPSTLLQIGIGVADLAFCTLAMFVLLPGSPSIDFIAVAVIFVTATLLGFASHAPGGLGIFDAAMLVGLWQFDREDLLAGLLMFRLLYYVAPFALSCLILGAREIMIAVLAAPSRPASPPGHLARSLAGNKEHLPR
jgi:uncharacterized membrane protein YbhN (UPF0104 family)